MTDAPRGDNTESREQESAAASGRATDAAAAEQADALEEGQAQGGKGRPPSDS